MEETPVNRKKKIIIAVAALAMIVAAVLGLYAAFGPKGTQGAKTIQVQTVFLDGTTKDHTIRTDAEFLRGALEQEGMVAGDESSYGLFVKTVDGYTVNSANQEWWCFTKNGETLENGVDTIAIADGDHYEVTLTAGY